MAGLFVAGLALRPQVIGLGPLLPGIQRELAVPHGISGLLATIPVLCMGAFALVAPAIATRLGTRRAIRWCLVGVTAAGAARAVSPGITLLLLTTLAVGVSVGLAGALLPIAVKQDHAHRPASATGVYAAGIQLGASGSALLAVPLAEAAGGWRGPLLVFAAFTGLLLVVWRGRDAAADPAPATSPPLPWRRPGVWLLALVFGTQSVAYYGLNAWLPAYLVERGWGDAGAGTLLGVMNVFGLVCSLTLPRLADRRGGRRIYLVAGAVALAASLVGFLTVPGLAWAWAPVTGYALGALFAMTLTLPLDTADDPTRVAGTAALVLGGGYGLAAVAPAGLGAVRDLSGSFVGALWLLAGMAILLAAVCATSSPERLAAIGQPARSRST